MIRPSQWNFSSSRRAIQLRFKDSVDEAARLLNTAKKPVILAGVELQRYGLTALFEQLVDQTNIPFATSLDGKSLISENHPLFAGVYVGALSRQEIRSHLEECDCLLSPRRLPERYKLGCVYRTTTRTCGDFSPRQPDTNCQPLLSQGLAGRFLWKGLSKS